MSLALDTVPVGIEIEKSRIYLASVAGVSKIHDPHVWGMSTAETALMAHLLIPAGYLGDALRNEICAERPIRSAGRSAKAG